MAGGGNRRRALAGAVMALAAGMAFPALADGRIAEVKIGVRNEYEPGTVKEPKVQVSGRESSVENVSWDVRVSDWEPGERRTGKIVLRADEGWTFGENGNRPSVQVSGAEYVSAGERENGSVLEVTVSYTPVLKLGQTESAGWDSASQGTAVWRPVPYAKAYQLRLYRAGSQEGGGEDPAKNQYVNMLTLTGTSADLSAYMQEEGIYFYTVRALATGSGESLSAGEEFESEKIVTIRRVSEGWEQINGRYQYTDKNGVRAAGGWKYIGGSWYYFDQDANAATGWQSIGGHWYYLDEQGRMRTGWLNEDGIWYYLSPTGAMATGWYELGPGNAYYFDGSGRMLYDTVVDGRRLGVNGRAE